MKNLESNVVLNTQGNTEMAELSTERSVDEERLHRKQRLVATFRLFGKFGFDEGLAGHVTARDPERLDHFWVNPMGVSFKQMKMSDLILVNDQGHVVEGQGLLNAAAFAIHSEVHKARPDVICAAHTHNVYGKALSALGVPLLPITQDACAFFNDHVVFSSFTGVVLDASEGKSIAEGLADNKAAILQNHGLITVGTTVESAAWWYITMERSCHTQLLAQAAGEPIVIGDEVAKKTHDTVGTEFAGTFSFLPLYKVICAEQPDLFD